MNTSWEADDSATDISLAPLIDCIFLLLIFFLLATTFTSEEKERPLLNLAEKRLPLELPRTDASLEKDAVVADTSGLLIEIDAAGNVYLDSEPTNSAALHTKIRDLAGRNIEVAVRADRATDYEHIVRVLELLRFNALDNIVLRTIEKEPYWNVDGAGKRVERMR